MKGWFEQQALQQRAAGAGAYPFWPEVSVQAGLAVDAAGVAGAVHTHAAPEVLPVDVQALVSVCHFLIVVTLLSLPMAVAC